MRTILLSLLLLSSVAVAQPPDILVQRTLYHGNDPTDQTDQLRQLYPMPDGGYVAIGTAVIDDEFKGWMVRMNTDLETEWDLLWPPTGQGNFRNLDRNDDGSFIVSGWNWSDLTILTISEDGEVLEATVRSDIEPGLIRRMPDGGMVIANKIGFNPGVTRYDAQGNVVWQNGYNSDSFTTIEDVEVLPNGGLLVAGSKMEVPFFHYPAARRISPSGQTIWHENYPTTELVATANDIVRLPNGVYAMCGLDETAFVRWMHPGTGEELDVLFFDWSDFGYYSKAHALIATADNGLVVAGEATSLSFEPRGVLTRLGSDGAELWTTSPDFPLVNFLDVCHGWDGSLTVMGQTEHGGSYGAYASMVYRYEPEVTMAATPGQVVFPPDGGTLEMDVSVSNILTQATPVVGWTSVVLPDSQVMTLQQLPVTLQPGGQWAGMVSQLVPAGAPAGEYSFRAQIGDPGSGIVFGRSEFTFTKQGAVRTADPVNWPVGRISR